MFSGARGIASVWPQAPVAPTPLEPGPKNEVGAMAPLGPKLSRGYGLIGAGVKNLIRGRVQKWMKEFLRAVVNQS